MLNWPILFVLLCWEKLKNITRKYAEFEVKKENLHDMYAALLQTSSNNFDLDGGGEGSNREMSKIGDLVSKGDQISRGNKYLGAIRRIKFVNEAVRAMESHCHVVGDSRPRPIIVLDSILEKMNQDELRFNYSENTHAELPIEPKVFSGVIIKTRDPYRELVEMVLDVDLRAINISGPPACGKTSFADKIVKDAEIRDVFGDRIYYTRVQGTLNKETFIAELCEKFYKSPFWGTDINALRVWIMNNCPTMLILDDVTPDWEAFLGELNFSITGFKLLILSEFKLLTFDGYDLNNMSDENGQKAYIHSLIVNEHPSNVDDLINKFMEIDKSSPSSLERFKPRGDAHLFMWERRNYNSFTGTGKVIAPIF